MKETRSKRSIQAETAQPEGSKSATRRTILRAAIGLVLVAAVASWLFVPVLHRNYIARTFGSMGQDRKEKLNQIRAALYKYKDEVGRWPTSIEELSTAVPEMEQVLDVPHLDGAVDYIIDFSVIDSNDPWAVLVADPGFDTSQVKFYFDENPEGPDNARWALMANGRRITHGILNFDAGSDTGLEEYWRNVLPDPATTGDRSP